MKNTNQKNKYGRLVAYVAICFVTMGDSCTEKPETSSTTSRSPAIPPATTTATTGSTTSRSPAIPPATTTATTGSTVSSSPVSDPVVTGAVNAGTMATGDVVEVVSNTLPVTSTISKSGQV